MGLRCVIGHDYGEPETSRDRHQRGNEVVVTVQEYRECRRCGHRRILAENKEVTADPDTEPADEVDAEAAWSAPESTEAADEPGAAEAEFSRSPSDEPVSAADDDGVILDDDSGPPPRAHGEWPETDHREEVTGVDDDPEPWPDEAPDSTAADAPTPEPEATAGPDATAEPGAESRTAEESGAGGPDRGPRSTRPGPDPSETELVCPDCGETWPSINASLRPGDICPECRLGYLDEQVIQ